jgi:DUF218 domain
MVVFSAIVPAPTGHFSKPQPADVAIVLENTVYADGSPSPRLAARLDRAISIGHTNLFFVSGGNDECGTGEALAMHRYLVRRGVPSNNIVVSGAGNDTWSTARNASAFPMNLLRQDRRIKAGLKIRRMLARAMSRQTTNGLAEASPFAFAARTTPVDQASTSSAACASSRSSTLVRIK